MTPEGRPSKTPAAETDLAGIADLLGGRRWLSGNLLEDLLALHDRLVRGLPASALRHFARHYPLLIQDPAFDRVLGSPPPHEGARSGRTNRLSSHESSQLWRLAIILMKAAPLFGGAEAAERWLIRRVFGLGRRRPLELLETPAGYELVADHLNQLEYGTYV